MSDGVHGGSRYTGAGWRPGTVALAVCGAVVIAGVTACSAGGGTATDEPADLATCLLGTWEAHVSDQGSGSASSETTGYQRLAFTPETVTFDNDLTQVFTVTADGETTHGRVGLFGTAEATYTLDGDLLVMGEVLRDDLSGYSQVWADGEEPPEEPTPSADGGLGPASFPVTCEGDTLTVGAVGGAADAAPEVSPTTYARTAS